MFGRMGLAALMLLGAIAAPRAEVGDITVAQQFGVSFLPLMIMERDGLIEKHARDAGMAKSGSVKDKPESWKDLFFPEIHALPGD